MKTNLLTHKTNIYLGMPKNSNFGYNATHIEDDAYEAILSYQIIPLRTFDGYKGMKFRIPMLDKLVRKVREKLRGKPKEENAVIEKVEIDSSNLDTIAYSPETELLQVVFKSGGIYLYYKVPQKTYDKLLLAPSKGKYFHKEIRSKPMTYKYDVIR